MWATKVGPTTKNFKKNHWLKRPKAVPSKKRNLDQNINDSKSYIVILFLKILLILFRATFLYFPHVPVDINRGFFLISDFLAGSLKANKN